MPRFRAADSTSTSMLNYIGHNVRYPVEALKSRASGTVFVTFVVNKQGLVEQAQVAQGAHYALKDAALRVVQAMPVWEQPGRQQGQPVNVRLTVPVRFAMQTGSLAALQKAQQPQQLTATNATADATPAAGVQPPRFEHDPLGAVHYLQLATQSVKARKASVAMVSFTVKADGQVGDVLVAPGISPEVDAAVVQAVQQMPAWKPGTQQGQPVAVPFTNIPIRISGK
ncbi:TonB family protein [Hymenobacter daecheongensis]|nr:TonB family protein [Hymenobacter daecheongensis]